MCQALGITVNREGFCLHGAYILVGKQKINKYKTEIDQGGVSSSAFCNTLQSALGALGVTERTPSIPPTSLWAVKASLQRLKPQVSQELVPDPLLESPPVKRARRGEKTS